MKPVRLVLIIWSLAACGGDGAPAGEDAGVPDAEVPDAAGGPDATPPPLRESAGGNPKHLALAGGRAYVGVGARLAIWDVADPAAPALLGETSLLPGLIEGVAAEGSHAYVIERKDLDGQLHVFDAADPAAPVEVASWRLAPEGEPTAPIDVEVAAGRLYVADQEHGITVYDVTAPATPAVVTTIALPGVTSVRVVESRLYYGMQGFVGDWVGVLDLLGGYAEIGGVSAPGLSRYQITPQHLLVGIGAGGLQVYDLTDAAAPVQTFVQDGLFSRAIAAVDGAAWLPADDGLWVLDLTAATPSLSGPIDATAQGANAADLDGGLLAFVTDRGRLVTVDVTAPAAPSPRGVSDVTVCSEPWTAYPVGDVLVIADTAGGLRTATRRDLAPLGRAGEVPGEMVDFTDVVATAEWAYVADWWSGLRVFDVSDPSAPAFVTLLATGGYPSSVALQGDRLYLGESTNGGALIVIDVADPAHPTVLGSTPTSKARDVEVRGEMAYVADESLDGPGGLRIFDVANPAAIQPVGTYDGCRDVLDVALVGGVAVLACGGDDFHLVDVSDPANPTQLGVVALEAPDSAWSVAAEDGRAYLGSAAAVFAVDITDPTAPVVLAERAVPRPAVGLTLPAPGTVIASCGWAGLFQWELP